MLNNNKKLLIITAKHKITNKYVNMYFYSIKQAKFYNNDFVDFKVIRYINDNNDNIYIVN
jgi:hypothetical protein